MSKKRERNQLRSEQGTSLIELAFMLPLLILLVLGTLDVGRGFSSYITLTTAAREGARWITINPDDANGAFGRVFAEAGRGGLTQGDFQVTISPLKDRFDAGDEVTVNVMYDHPLLFGFVPNVDAMPIDIRVTMVVLYD